MLSAASRTHMELKKHESIDVHCFLFSLSQHVKVRPLIMCKDQNIEGHALTQTRGLHWQHNDWHVRKL